MKTNNYVADESELGIVVYGDSHINDDVKMARIMNIHLWRCPRYFRLVLTSSLSLHRLS